MELKDELKKALEDLRKNDKRKFNQSVDLIINLQKYDIKKNPINLFVALPYKVKDKKICAFLEAKNNNVETITRDEFKKYSEKKLLKNLIKKYDFFISQASVMPSVATTFGRILGPVGKMPSPQLGIIFDVNEKTIEETKAKINGSVKLRTKDSSIKLSIGKENMKDSDIIENILVVYNSLLKSLTKGKDNIKNIELKLTMTKPVRVNLR